MSLPYGVRLIESIDYILLILFNICSATGFIRLPGDISLGTILGGLTIFTMLYIIPLMANVSSNKALLSLI